MIHVFIGTKAQYIKMAPLLRLLDAQRVAYRLIDSGQHSNFAATLRSELQLREPDLRLGSDHDVVTTRQALRWSAPLILRLASRRKLRAEVFGGSGGVCLVHGDTPSTLLAALAARRAGLQVALVEAGLRTYRWFHPFPEEIIRVLVSRMAAIHFAPGPDAAANLRNAKVKGRIVEQDGSTVLESVRVALADSPAGAEQPNMGDGSEADAAAAPPAIVTMHRVENLYRRSRRETLVDLVCGLAAQQPVRWVLHGPTEQFLAGSAHARLQSAGVDLMPLHGYRKFLTSVARAPFVITDGGTMQEECALLGVPTLIWRDRADRDDGLDANVVVSHYDPEVAAEFLADVDRYRRPPQALKSSPSEQILAELADWR